MRKIAKPRLLLALFVGVVLLVGAGDDSARVARLGHTMMCACGCNQILLECNHVGCTYSDRMRGELISAVDDGKSDDAVLQFFVQKYGTLVLAAPTKTGFNRVAWVMPYAALVLGIGALVVVVNHWRSRIPVASISNSTPEDPERNRLREQIRRETQL